MILLEPNAWKPARSVLRGERSSNTPALPDVNQSMNKLINKAVFILAIILIFGSFIFKSRETTTDKKLEINHIDISNNNPSQANNKNLNNLLIVKEEYILSYTNSLNACYTYSIDNKFPSRQ